jgi:hypothetical protein
MSKIIKLKESDIEKIVSTILTEEYHMEEDMDVSEVSPSQGGSDVNFTYATNNKTGEVYIVIDPQSDNPKIYATGEYFKK